MISLGFLLLFLLRMEEKSRHSRNSIVRPNDLMARIMNLVEGGPRLLSNSKNESVVEHVCF